MLIYCLLILTVLVMKSNQKIFMEIFLNIKTCLTLVNFNQIFFNWTNKRIIGKMKDEFKGIPINKFMGLKSKMYCTVSDDDTKVNIIKRVNISIEFNEYKNILFKKK